MRVQGAPEGPESFWGGGSGQPQPGAGILRPDTGREGSGHLYVSRHSTSLGKARGPRLPAGHNPNVEAEDSSLLLSPPGTQAPLCLLHPHKDD